MLWKPPLLADCKSDEALLDEFNGMPVVPRSTGFHMYQIVIRGKDPILAGELERPAADLEELTPAQARYAFHRGWVPRRLFERVKAIALSDGRSGFPMREL